MSLVTTLSKYGFNSFACQKINEYIESQQQLGINKSVLGFIFDYQDKQTNLPQYYNLEYDQQSQSLGMDEYFIQGIQENMIENEDSGGLLYSRDAIHYASELIEANGHRYFPEDTKKFLQERREKFLRDDEEEKDDENRDSDL